MPCRVIICCDETDEKQYFFPSDCIVCQAQADHQIPLEIRGHRQRTPNNGGTFSIPYCEEHYHKARALCERVTYNRDVFLLGFTFILSFALIPFDIWLHPFLIIEGYVDRWQVLNFLVLFTPIVSFLISVALANGIYKPILIRRLERQMDGQITTPGLSIRQRSMRISTDEGVRRVKTLIMDFFNEDVGEIFKFINSV